MTASPPDNEAIFHAARDIPDPDRRREYVRDACGADEARIAHIEALLAAAQGPDSLLDRPAACLPMATIDQPAIESPGTVIGPYKLIEQIGEGGMGSVWMAQQTEPVKRLVAVKLIKAGMDSRQVIARFEAERQGLPTLAANRGTEPARLTKLVRGELDWIVMRALEKDRNRRYETANGFAMDVERYLADEPVQACPPSAAYRLRKFARRNKGALAVAALVLFFLALLGTGAGWVVRDRSARDAELREAVTAALDKVTDLRQRARWGEAQAVLEQVRQRLLPSGADDLRHRVEQAEADLALVNRLEAARLNASGLTGSKFDTASAAREYAAAFRQAGIGEGTEATQAVADRIRSSAVREQLAAAVDDWAVRVGKDEPARRAWLLAVARAADPDPWRNRFRDEAVWNDRTALERLAREANVSELSPQFIHALAVLLARADAGAMPLLTAAQGRYPSDFWLNLGLGMALHRAQRWEEAIGYYRAALALRPAASAVYSNLGLALQEKGRVNEAIAEYQKAIELDPKSKEKPDKK
jgi:tetratricopeptide (TPR) repeat protein